MWSLLWIIIKCIAWFCAIPSQCLKKTGSSGREGETPRDQNIFISDTELIKLNQPKHEAAQPWVWLPLPTPPPLTDFGVPYSDLCKKEQIWSLIWCSAPLVTSNPWSHPTPGAAQGRISPGRIGGLLGWTGSNPKGNRARHGEQAREKSRKNYTDLPETL